MRPPYPFPAKRTLEQGIPVGRLFWGNPFLAAPTFVVGGPVENSPFV